MTEEPIPSETETAPGARRRAGEIERARILLEVTGAVVSNLGLGHLLRATSGCLRAYFRHDFAALSLYDEGTDSLHVHASDRARPDTDIYEGEPVPVEGPLTGLAFTTRRAVYRSPIDAGEAHAPMMPHWMQQISYANPVRHFSTIARGVLLKGVGLDILYPNLLALAAFAFLIVGASIWRFRKQLS